MYINKYRVEALLKKKGYKNKTDFFNSNPKISKSNFYQLFGKEATHINTHTLCNSLDCNINDICNITNAPIVLCKGMYGGSGCSIY